MEEKKSMSEDLQEATAFVIYKRRYLSLGILLLATLLVYLQSVLYPAVGHALIKYYGVHYELVNGLSIVPELLMLILFYPIGKFIEKCGFRKSMLLATFISLVANLVKCFAIRRSLYWYWCLMCAQFLVEITSFIATSCASVFATEWFRPEEVANVIGASSAASTVGVVVSFLFPSALFSDLSSIETIEFNLKYLTYSIFGVSSIVFLITWFFLEDKPKTPPCLAQESRPSNDSVTKLLGNKSAILIIIAYCLNASLTISLMTTLNQTLLTSYAGNTTVLSISGVLNCIAGIFGSLTVGYVLQMFPKYKIICIIYGLFYVTFTSTFVLSLRIESVLLLYPSIFFIGFIANSFFVLLMDFLIEVTYPFSEGMLTTITITVCNIPLFGLVPLVTHLTTIYNAVVSNTSLIAIAVIFAICALLTKEDLRRRNADEKQKATHENPDETVSLNCNGLNKA